MKTQFTMARTLLAGVALVSLIASPLARADYSSTVLSQGPVGYWRLNETLTPSVVAGAVNSGSLGGAVLGAFNNYPTRGLTGPFTGSKAVGLDGSSQTVTTPWQAAINPNPFSVELWVKPDQASFFGYVGSSVHLATSRSGWYLAQDNGGTFGHGDSFVIRLFNQNGTTQTITLWAPVLGAGVWHHLVLTYDGANAALYENGVLASGSGPAGFVANVDLQFSLGFRSDTGFPWPGQVAEVAVYGAGLTSGQVANHYTVATTTPASYASTVTTDAALLYYRFQEPIDPPAANLGSKGASGNGLFIADTKAGVAGPASPTYPGLEAANKAAAFDAGGGVVRIPPLNLNVNTFTISCWINATNAQAAGAGIVIHGSGTSASGLTIDSSGGLGLGYIWNNNNYGWNPTPDSSGAFPALPDSQWAYAALVIQPTEAALYICDANNSGNFTSITNTFNVSHAAQAFASATLFGAAGGYANRNLNAGLDEVAIFDRALGAGELFTQYATAVGGVKPRVFVDLIGPTDPVAAGDPIVLKVDAGGTAPLTFIWHSTSGAADVVTTTNVFVIPTAALSDAGDYDVTITNLSGSASSGPVHVSTITPTMPTATEWLGFHDRTLYKGGTLKLAVAATGGGLKYKWYKGGSVIAGATATSYIIPGVTNTDAGNFSVLITNAVGSISNGPIAITIPNVGSNTYDGVIITAGPEAWWRLDETGSTNMFDGMGRHDGVYTNAEGGVTLPTMGATGALITNANKAATFSSTGKGIGMAPFSPDLNPGKFSIEAWVKPSVTTGQVPFSSSYGGGGCFLYENAGWWNGAIPTLTVFGNNNNVNTAGAIIAGQWSHVVIRYDNTVQSGGTFYPFTLYVNGQTDGYIWGGGPQNTGGPFIIGARGVSASVLADLFADATIDEVAVYKRVLSATEIQSHYATRGFEVIPPAFTSPFLSQTVTMGKSITFSTTVVGTTPVLNWYKGTPLASAPIATGTNTIRFSSTALGDSGTYSLVASNSAGTATNTATLTVISPVGYANVTNNLVLHLTFDTDTTDSSGRANDGTPSSPTAPAFVPGHIGAQALEYTTVMSGASVASASYVTLGAVAPTDLRFGVGTSFTVGLWVKLGVGSLIGDLPFIGTETNSANNPGWVLCPSYQKGGWQWDLNDGSVNIDVNGPDASINDGNWHNFVLVVDRTAAAADTYLDGVHVASRSIATLGSLDHDWPIVIGQDPSLVYTEGGTAAVDDIGIWREALTPLQVAQIASAGATAGRSFNTVAPPLPTLTVSRSGADLVLTYTGGTLVESTTLCPTCPNPPGEKDTWTPVAGASSPWTVTPSGAKKFYSVRE